MASSKRSSGISPPLQRSRSSNISQPTCTGNHLSLIYSRQGQGTKPALKRRHIQNSGQIVQHCRHTVRVHCNTASWSRSTHWFGDGPYMLVDILSYIG